MTAARLRKVANLIAAFANNAYRRNPASNAVAIADWEENLDFLKQHYYDGYQIKFEPWPSPRRK